MRILVTSGTVLGQLRGSCYVVLRGSCYVVRTARLDGFAIDELTRFPCCEPHQLGARLAELAADGGSAESMGAQSAGSRGRAYERGRLATL